MCVGSERNQWLDNSTFQSVCCERLQENSVVISGAGTFKLNLKFHGRSKRI